MCALGDSALGIDFADESDDPGVRLRRALSAAAALERAKIPVVKEITSSYQSVALLFDLTVPEVSIEQQIRDILSRAETSSLVTFRHVDIPVCYDDDFALDSQRVATETKLPFKTIVGTHSATEFTVACIGFMPGFPYLSGLPPELQVPRLATPRTKIPAGSVAIANAQAGIYPTDSPGGWNIIGRTPLPLFNPSRVPPTRLAPGDRVRFRVISREEFEKFVPNET